MRTRLNSNPLPAAILCLTLLCGFGTGAYGNAPETAALCDRAARAASQSEQVPLGVLQSITRAETGRSLNGLVAPWPWAASANGDGAWFDSRDEALHHIESVLNSGSRDVDIGCFQLNHRWHADGFAYLRDMIEPESNARYAAQFLRWLQNEFGDWDAAVAAYHSRNSTYTARYMARFRDGQGNLPDAPPTQVDPTRAPVSGASPLDLDARLSLLPRAGGLNAQGAAPLLSAQPARSLFGDRP